MFDAFVLLLNGYGDLRFREQETLQARACAITFGEQSLGEAVGPAFEAREALTAIMGNGPADLNEKATIIADMLFEMVGVEKGKQMAENILKSGKAESKLREIIEVQGGDPEIKPEEIKIGDKKLK